MVWAIQRADSLHVLRRIEGEGNECRKMPRVRGKEGRPSFQSSSRPLLKNDSRDMNGARFLSDLSPVLSGSS